MGESILAYPKSGLVHECMSSFAHAHRLKEAFALLKGSVPLPPPPFWRIQIAVAHERMSGFAVVHGYKEGIALPYFSTSKAAVVQEFMRWFPVLAIS